MIHPVSERREEDRTFQTCGTSFTPIFKKSGKNAEACGLPGGGNSVPARPESAVKDVLGQERLWAVTCLNCDTVSGRHVYTYPLHTPIRRQESRRMKNARTSLAN
ncbi:uncharacterized protein LOC143436757 [Arvicanthis niloticus]|uniref:uncharacterized protein LOC143436757 n=1 Tax=Arvicanthis niloticus TaxID=61156 RepID=UPI00403C3ADD